METRKITIEKLVAGGHGLGRVDGRVILVPFSAPGDEALIEVGPARKGVGWGTIKKILTPSPSRTDPFCVHYTRCGGCQIQHIAYPHQLKYKRLILEDALRRLSGCEDVSVGSCIGSPVDTGYRTRVRLHCSGKNLGFFKTRSNAVIPVERCPVLSDRLNDCLKDLFSFVHAYPAKELSEIQMAEGSDSRVLLTLVMDSEPGAEYVNELKKSVSAVSAVLKVGRRINLLWRSNYSTLIVEGRTFRVAAGSFFQANLSLLPALINHVVDRMGGKDIDTMVELYAGVGVFSIILAGKARQIVAVEWNRSAAEDARTNQNINRTGNVDVMSMSAEDALDLLSSRSIKSDMVILDPPREGLSVDVRKKLIRLPAQQIIYISCDPATLARDTKSILASGEYDLEKITPLDMFPHTSHVETVCSFVRD